MKYNNIFITGSTGVVGKPILQKIIDQGHNVFALSRSKKNDRWFSDLGVTKIEGDLFTESIYDDISDCDIEAIFHIAGVNKMCSKNPQGMFKANIEGTKEMLQLGNRLKIKKFIYTSSAVTLGEELGTIGNELSSHRGYFLSKYEESKYLAEQEAFDYDKDFEFVSVNPSSVQGPGRVSGTAKLLISTLNKKYPPLIKNNISIVDIDDCTDGHYQALVNGEANQRYVLNSFQTTSEELLSKLKSLSEWSGRPMYLPKSVLKIIAPLGDLYKLVSSSSPLICSESARVLTHGHIYDGSKAGDKLNLSYINLEMFMKKTINWLIDESYVKLKKI
jgi:dihydroflavonol-4-reductase